MGEEIYTGKSIIRAVVFEFIDRLRYVGGRDRKHILKHANTREFLALALNSLFYSFDFEIHAPARFALNSSYLEAQKNEGTFESSELELCDFIKKGWLSSVGDSLKKGPCEERHYLIKGLPNPHWTAEGLPIVVAAEHGRTEVVKLLIDEYGVKNLDQALFAAACGRHLETAKLLVESGAKINVRCPTKAKSLLSCVLNKRSYSTAFIEAVRNCDIPMIEFLHEQGADPNITLESCGDAIDEHSGETALSLNSKCSHNGLLTVRKQLKVARILIKHSADPDQKPYQLSDSSLAKCKIRKAAAIAMITGIDADGDPCFIVGQSRAAITDMSIPKECIFPGGLKDGADLTFQAAAIREASEEIGVDLQYLIEQGKATISEILSYEKVSDDGKTFHQYYFYQFDLGVHIQALEPMPRDDLEALTTIKTKDVVIQETPYGPIYYWRKDNTPIRSSNAQLMLHAQSANLEESIVANIKQTIYEEAEGEFLICKAAKEGDIEKIKMLLSRNIAVNCWRNGMTPLMVAAQHGQYEAAEYLITQGADVKLCYQDTKKTALHYAAMAGSVEICALLLKQGADINTQCDASCNEPQYSPLMMAAKHGHPRVVNLLITKGATVERVGTIWRNAFVIAAQHAPKHGEDSQGHKAVLELLLAQGVDLNLCGITALKAVLRYPGNFDIIKLIVDALIGTNIEIPEEIKESFFCGANRSENGKNYPIKEIQDLFASRALILKFGEDHKLNCLDLVLMRSHFLLFHMLYHSDIPYIFQSKEFKNGLSTKSSDLLEVMNGKLKDTLQELKKGNSSPQYDINILQQLYQHLGAEDDYKQILEKYASATQTSTPSINHDPRFFGNPNQAGVTTASQESTSDDQKPVGVNTPLLETNETPFQPQCCPCTIL